MIEYLYLIIGLVLAAVVMYFFYIFFRGKDSKSRSASGWFMWGPFWPRIDDYLKKHGGLTKREIIGWIIVFLIMVLAVLSDRIFPIR